MAYRILSLLIACFLLTVTAAAQSDKPVWTAWLFNPFSGNAWLIDDDGAVLRDLSGLGHSEYYINHFPRIGSQLMEYPDIAVSSTGRYFAYLCEDLLCVLDTTTGQEILAYDLIADEQVAPFSTLTYSWVRRLFNEDGCLYPARHRSRCPGG
jgi:hypothetical protein